MSLLSFKNPFASILFCLIHEFLELDQDARDRLVCKNWNEYGKKVISSRKARIRAMEVAQIFSIGPMPSVLKFRKITPYHAVTDEKLDTLLLENALEFGQLEIVKYLVEGPFIR